MLHCRTNEAIQLPVRPSQGSNRPRRSYLSEKDHALAQFDRAVTIEVHPWSSSDGTSGEVVRVDGAAMIWSRENYRPGERQRGRAARCRNEHPRWPTASIRCGFAEVEQGMTLQGSVDVGRSRSRAPTGCLRSEWCSQPASSALPALRRAGQCPGDRRRTHRRHHRCRDRRATREVSLRDARTGYAAASARFARWPCASENGCRARVFLHPRAEPSEIEVCGLALLPTGTGVQCEVLFDTSRGSDVGVRGAAPRAEVEASCGIFMAGDIGARFETVHHAIARRHPDARDRAVGLMFAKNTTLALGTVGDARVLRGTVSPALPLEGGVFGYVDVALRQVTRLDESG
jgi:hypothetical protein